MWDFSDDEWLFFMVAGVIAAICFWKYYAPLLTVPLIGRSFLRRCFLAIIPPISLVLVLFAVRYGSDRHVAGHRDYIFMFVVGGAAWVLAAARLVSLLGFSIRFDAVERDNPAATLAGSGAILGTGITYAAANLGAGPTIWTTILPAMAGSMTLMILAFLIQIIGGDVADDIAIERDAASGMRWAGMIIGGAIILGCAEAGDWVSWEATWSDFARKGWPALVLAISAGAVHRNLRPTAQNPRANTLTAGVLPTIAFIVAGLIVVAIEDRGLIRW